MEPTPLHETELNDAEYFDFNTNFKGSVISDSTEITAAGSPPKPGIVAG